VSEDESRDGGWGFANGGQGGGGEGGWGERTLGREG